MSIASGNLKNFISFIFLFVFVILKIKLLNEISQKQFNQSFEDFVMIFLLLPFKQTICHPTESPLQFGVV